VGHVVLAAVALAYLFRFKIFYSRLGAEHGNGISNGNSNTYSTGPHGSSQCGPALGFGNGNNNMSSGLKKRIFVAKWGCLQARAMFGAALFVLSLCTIVVISVSMVSLIIPGETLSPFYPNCSTAASIPLLSRMEETSVRHGQAGSSAYVRGFWS